MSAARASTTCGSSPQPLSVRKIKPMDDAERELTLRWIRTWAQAGPELEAMTGSDVSNHVTYLCFPDDPPEAAKSGLVQQQRWFAKIRRKLEEQR